MKIFSNLFKFRRKPNAIIHDTAKLYSRHCIENNFEKPDAIIIGANTHVKGQLLTFGHGGKIVIGEYCYIGENTKIWSAKHIYIGNRVLIAHNSNIFDNNTHPFDPIQRHQQFKAIISKGHPRSIDLAEQPIFIEDDVWISCMAVILPGVKIGKGSIVAAGSVVTKDIDPGSLVAGNPAKFIRKI